MPPSKPAAAGLIPNPTVADSISEAVNSSTPPLVDASIQAYEIENISVVNIVRCAFLRTHGIKPW